MCAIQRLEDSVVRRPSTFYSNDANFNDGESIPLEPGERVRLKCNYKGNPSPEISWYKNEKKIHPKSIKEVDGTRRITIANKRYLSPT